MPARSAAIMTNRDSLRGLQIIPGVGPSIALDLLDLGIERPDDLRKTDPDELYDQLCLMRGMQVDRCMLYVFRCGVYFASHQDHDPELLKWWNWTDERASARI